MTTISIYSLPNLLVGLGFLILGVSVWLRNKKNLQNILFFLTAVAASSWLLIYSVIYSIEEPETALILFKIGYSFVLPIVVLATHFLFLFLGLEKKFRKFFIFSYFFVFLLVFLNLITPLFVKGVFKYFWGYYPNVNTPLNSLYLVFFASSIAMIYLFSWKQFFLLKKRVADLKSAPAEQELNKIKFIILGVSVFALAGVDFVAGYGFKIYPFGYLPALIFIGLTAYAVFYKKTLDIGAETREKIIKTEEMK